MKKIIALLISFGMFATAFSQSKEIEEARRIINGEPKQEKKVYREANTRYPAKNNKTYKKHRKYKKDNGRHLGWEKGVGNPHKSGSKKKYAYKNGKKK